jgi:hypothetical protein
MPLWKRPFARYVKQNQLRLPRQNFVDNYEMSDRGREGVSRPEEEKTVQLKEREEAKKNISGRALKIPK